MCGACVEQPPDDASHSQSAGQAEREGSQGQEEGRHEEAVHVLQQVLYIFL